MFFSNEKIWWTKLGTLTEFQAPFLAGCYLFVWDKKRIIYVGTSQQIANRLQTHVKAIRDGKRPVWRVGEDEDIYSLMKNFKSNKQTKLLQLAKEGYIWVNYERNNETKNLLNPEDNFDTNWKQYIEERFLSKIEVWATGINGNKQLITLLESRIQLLLRGAFNLGSLYSRFDQSWLGKIEHPYINTRVKFDFQNYPDIDDESIEVLKCINQSYIEKTVQFKDKPKTKKIKFFSINPEDKILYKKNAKRPINETTKKSGKKKSY